MSQPSYPSPPVTQSREPDLSSEKTNEKPPRKRRRPALACFECRRRKVKCDRSNPCSGCVQLKCNCVYSSAVSTTHVNRYDAGHQFILPSLISAQDGARSPVPVNYLSNTNGIRQDDRQSSRQVIPFGNDKTVEELLQRIKNLEQQLLDAQKPAEHSLGVATDQPDPPARSAVPLNQFLKLAPLSNDAQTSSTSPINPSASAKSMRGALSKSRIFGQSHWMGHFQQFQSISPFNFWRFDKASFVADDRFVEISTLLDKCKALGRAIKAQRPSRWFVPSERDFKNYVPPREITDQLVDTYFRCFESTYRVLHVPSFRNEYIQFWENPDAAGIGFVVKLLLVIAIGASLCQTTDSCYQDFSNILQWVYAAQTWLSVPFEKSRLNLTGLQIYCLLLIARQHVYVAPELVYIPAGSLLRTAMTMGLQRDPRNFPKMSILHMEIRRRLWATIVELCVQSSLDSGMPPMISLSDFDTEAPSNINDYDIDETTIIPPLSRPENVFTQTSLQITLFKSLRARLDAARVANDLFSEPSYETVLELSSEIQKACREANSLFKLKPQEGLVSTSFHRNLINFLIRRFLLTLHHPFAFKARKDPRYYFSRKICLETALDLATPEPDRDFFNLMALAGGLYRNLSTHCSITFWFEIITQQEDDLSSGIVDRGRHLASIAPVREACKNLHSMLQTRVRHGETNIKGEMFMSMVVGQIEAIEAGNSQEEAIFQSALMSVRSSYEILKSRLQSDPQNVRLDSDRQEGAVQGNEEEPDLDYDFLQDGNLNFELPDSWLYSHGWDENSWNI